jgi:pimeloyl-ACP methyl ester carboxylesterase
MWTTPENARGAVRAICAATRATVDVVEQVHRTIQVRPPPVGAADTGGTRGITGLVYRCVRGGIELVGGAIDSGLALTGRFDPDDDRSPKFEAHRAVANGIFGDYLSRTANPLAISASVRYRGSALDCDDPASTLAKHGSAPAGNRLLLLVHGLCMNDAQWARDGHDHGARLADDLGFLPLYLHYNSGLPIAHNGLAFARLLERLLANWHAPVEELVIIGHSMGGLVARSACHQAGLAGHAWPEHLRKLVFLGTPHHGAPLERGGVGIDTAMQWSPYSGPIARLSSARSAGIKDLRHGTVSADGSAVPLPEGVRCYAAAAALAAEPGMVGHRWVGDGLVPLDSALGRHRDPTHALGFAQQRQWVGYGMGHLELLHHPDVYEQLHAWVRE